VTVAAAGESLRLAVMNFGNPQCVALGSLPDPDRFQHLGPAPSGRAFFRSGPTSNSRVESPGSVRILIWERGVGPTLSSGTGFLRRVDCRGGVRRAARDAEVIALGAANGSNGGTTASI